jgi:hypothetical protein
MVTDALSKAMGDDYNLEPSFMPHMAAYVLSSNRTVSELLETYVNNKLYFDYCVELWSAEEKAEDRFLMSVLYSKEDEKFEVLYSYPFDMIKARDYYSLLSANEMKSIFISEKPIFRIDYNYLKEVDWDFIQPFWKYPKFDFVNSDISYSQRFSQCGLHLTTSLLWFEMVKMPDIKTVYKIEYDSINKKFSLDIHSKGLILFDCTYKNGTWKYVYNGEFFEKFEQLFLKIE